MANYVPQNYSFITGTLNVDLQVSAQNQSVEYKATTAGNIGSNYLSGDIVTVTGGNADCTFSLD